MQTNTTSAPQRLPTNGPYFPADSSAIIITRIFSEALLGEIAKTVETHFALPEAEYIHMDANSYRAVVATAQDELNKLHLTRRLVEDRIDLLEDVLGSRDILVQKNLHLRATRPQTKSAHENIGWHRESFYGDGVERCVNFWTPIANVNAENTLRYVPDSHLIPEDRLETVRLEDPTTPKHSTGHIIGFPYAPKHIVSGVDFSQSRAFDVAKGEAAIFSGALIHGSADNRSNRIRFSIDFRLIASEAYGGRDRSIGGGNNMFVSL